MHSDGNWMNRDQREADEDAANAIRRDAERYRWLRMHATVSEGGEVHFGSGFNQKKPELLDAAIDNSMRYPCPVAGTNWLCEQCGKSGAISHEQDIDMYSAIQLLEDDHQRVSAGCKFDPARVRVTPRQVIQPSAN